MYTYIEHYPLEQMPSSEHSLSGHIMLPCCLFGSKPHTKYSFSHISKIMLETVSLHLSSPYPYINFLQITLDCSHIGSLTFYVFV